MVLLMINWIPWKLLGNRQAGSHKQFSGYSPVTSYAKRGKVCVLEKILSCVM